METPSWDRTSTIDAAKSHPDKRTMQTFLSHIAWESEVWIADDPDHVIHFNGERFLGPYPDVMPTISGTKPNALSSWH